MALWAKDNSMQMFVNLDENNIVFTIKIAFSDKSYRICLPSVLDICTDGQQYTDAWNMKFIITKTIMAMALVCMLSLAAYGNVNDDFLGAARDGDLRLVKKALNSGANINATKYGGKTALILAAYNEQPEVAAYLIEQGADVSIKDDDQKTALMYAVEMVFDLKREEGNSELADKLTAQTISTVITPLIEKGADVNATTPGGRTVLMYAVPANNIGTVEILLQNGANVNAQDDDGNSALRWALILESYDDDATECVEMLNLLLQYGADVHLKNKKGETILMSADSDAVITLLKNAGAQ